MIDKVKEQFLDKGIPLNVFLLDAFWQVDGWDINPRAFPHGFEPIKKRLGEIGLPMGLWMGLTQGGGNRQWCESHGYETTDAGWPCFAGPRWGEHVRKQLLRYIQDYDLACWKTDYTSYTCEKTDHGHLGGLYSVSAHADAMIDMQREIRRVKPDFYAFDGFWMSPWWLMYVDTIWAGPYRFPRGMRIPRHQCPRRADHQPRCLYLSTHQDRQVSGPPSQHDDVRAD